MSNISLKIFDHFSHSKRLCRCEFSLCFSCFILWMTDLIVYSMYFSAVRCPHFDPNHLIYILSWFLQLSCNPAPARDQISESWRESFWHSGCLLFAISIESSSVLKFDNLRMFHIFRCQIFLDSNALGRQCSSLIILVVLQYSFWFCCLHRLLWYKPNQTHSSFEPNYFCYYLISKQYFALWVFYSSFQSQY